MISVITPVYNTFATLPRCLASVREQEADVEHIVIDDGSTDGARAWLEAQPGIRLLVQERRGAAAARNTALEAARGRWVKFLDADDWLLPGALRQQQVQAEALTAMEIVYGTHEMHYPDGRVEALDRTKTPHAHHPNPLVSLVLSNILGTLALYPVSALRDVGGFDARLPGRQEWNLNLRLARAGYRFVFRPAHVFVQYMGTHPDRISNRPFRLETEDPAVRDALYPLEEVRHHADVACAVAAYLWQIGRRFVRQGDRGAALSFFRWAREWSPDGGSPFYPSRYRTLIRQLGPWYTDRLAIWLYHAKKKARRISRKT